MTLQRAVAGDWGSEPDLIESLDDTQDGAGTVAILLLRADRAEPHNLGRPLRRDHIVSRLA